jgi:hypothetical protein
MSLLSVLLQVENVFDGKFVVREGKLWLILVPVVETAPGPDARPKIPEETAKGDGKKPTDQSKKQ